MGVCRPDSRNQRPGIAAMAEERKRQRDSSPAPSGSSSKSESDETPLAKRAAVGNDPVTPLQEAPDVALLPQQPDGVLANVAGPSTGPGSALPVAVPGAVVVPGLAGPGGGLIAAPTMGMQGRMPGVGGLAHVPNVLGAAPQQWATGPRPANQPPRGPPPATPQPPSYSLFELPNAGPILVCVPRAPPWGWPCEVCGNSRTYLGWDYCVNPFCWRKG